MKGAELLIGYDDDSFPSMAVCSACGEPMPKCDPPRPDPHGNLEWFEAQFDIHILIWHSLIETEQVQ